MKNAIGVARAVMDHTENTLLVGESGRPVGAGGLTIGVAKAVMDHTENTLLVGESGRPVGAGCLTYRKGTEICLNNVFYF